MQFLETSAFQSTNVEQAFIGISKQIKSPMTSSHPANSSKKPSDFTLRVLEKISSRINKSRNILHHSPADN
ncbi:unnamed protein product [Ambrosiozyma monospora]|uniref:Unnamed protein product n=1 Tax=Ambrosiozyma monospora TaxID=43982 RepID=A0A9W6Z0R4_AMBMO|nr:unnamed protein product [Ambrosiozyma monospora]